MKKGNNKETVGSSLSDSLFRAFEEASLENDAAIREELAECGVDPGQVVEDGLHLVKTLLGQQKLRRAESEYQRIKEAIQEMAQNAGGWTADLLDKIARDLAGDEGKDNEHLVGVFHRKLESIEPEDLASLDDEKKLLKIVRHLRSSEK